MQKEPLAVTTAIRFILNGFVQGLILWGVINPTTEQHAWLTFTFAGMVEMLMWLITRSDVWAPAGAPTHPPTEALWSDKVAATQVQASAALANQKAEYEALFSAPGHAGPGLSQPVTSDIQISQETTEALVDTVNPGQGDV